MVEIEVTATVERTETSRDSGKNGRADYIGSARLKETRTVSATLEYPRGYVNLEGYAAGNLGRSAAEVAESVLMKAGVDVDEWNVRADGDAQVEIHGTHDEWLTAAHRYISERPEMEIDDALKLFARWDVTNLERDELGDILAEYDDAAPDA